MFGWTAHLNGVPKISYHAAVIVEHRVFSFGGEDSNDSDHTEALVFNTVSLRWMKLSPTGRGEHSFEVPSRRKGHTAVLIEYTIYIWGGYIAKTAEYCNRLYAFDVDTHRWFTPKISGTVPEARYCHSACALGKVMYIHGGNNSVTGRCNDIYKMDANTMVWALINRGGTPPPVSSRHSATIIGTKMFVFGGWGMQCNNFGYHNIRVFDIETNCWLNTPSAQSLPEGLSRHSAFAYNGELYIFGGYRDQGLNDLWKFNPETFSWKKVEPKGEGPGPGGRMCCCMVGDRIILFGAHDRPDDLYILDLSPSLKTLCKLAVIQYGLEQSGLPHNIRWELDAMTKKHRLEQN